MFFQNKVTLQGVVKTKPRKLKTKDGVTLIKFKMFTSIERNERGDCSSNPATHDIEFSSNYPTIYEHMKKGHLVLVTGSIDETDKGAKFIKASSVNWEEGQLDNQYPKVEESFEPNIRLDDNH